MTQRGEQGSILVEEVHYPSAPHHPPFKIFDYLKSAIKSQFSRSLASDTKPYLLLYITGYKKNIY